MNWLVFARTDYNGPQLTNLVDIINHVKPTALLGLSTLKVGIVQCVALVMLTRFRTRSQRTSSRPCPLLTRGPSSSPSPTRFTSANSTIKTPSRGKQSNAAQLGISFSFLLFRTDGKVIYASGSPYQPVVRDGVKLEAGQGNNMYIFPGIGLGSILSKTRHISDGMVEQAAIALALCLNAEERAAGLVYPRLVRIRDLSARIALTVIRHAQKEVSEGVADARAGFTTD